MRKRPFPMPLVDLALTKALHQLAIAQTAARLCDEDLAIEIAAATYMVRALSAKKTSLPPQKRLSIDPARRAGSRDAA